MNVFIVGTSFKTAQALDRKRLNKQIIECQQMLRAIDGAKAWHNHPCTIQYRQYREWLELYTLCLVAYRNGHDRCAVTWSMMAEDVRPLFHTTEYFDQMKRRLYTKDPVHYAQWANLGISDTNWYFVNDEWRYYRKGKRIN